MIIIRMRKTNVLYIRIDKYPELAYEIQRIMSDLKVDSYAEFLKLVVDMYNQYPTLFRDYVAGRSLKFIGIK